MNIDYLVDFYRDVIPSCPETPVKLRGYTRYDSYSLKDPDGLESLTLGVLNSAEMTKEFIYGVLHDERFPAVFGGKKHQTYIKNQDAYLRDMACFLERSNWLDDQDSLSVISSEQRICFDPTNAEDAIKAFLLEDIDSMLFENFCESVVFNCYIYWNDEDGVWSIEMVKPKNFDDLQWLDLGGSRVALPPWADSFDNII